MAGQIQADQTILAAQVEFFARNYPKADSLYRQLLTENRRGGIDFAGSCRFLAAVGFISKAAGENEKGDSLLREARSLDLRELQIAPDNLRLLYSLAGVSAALGERDAAIDALQRAVDAGWIDSQSMLLDPRFDSIRNAAQFQAAIDRIRARVDRMRSMSRAHTGTALSGEQKYAQ